MLFDKSHAVVWQSEALKSNSDDPVEAMNPARKQLWRIFERISMLRSVFKMFPWASAFKKWYELWVPSSQKLKENQSKTLKRERLHKRLNDYKLDFEVMKQENSHLICLAFLNLTIAKIGKNGIFTVEYYT